MVAQPSPSTVWKLLYVVRVQQASNDYSLCMTMYVNVQ